MGKKRAYRQRNQRGPRKPSPVVQGTLRVSGKGRATVETAEGVFAVARGGLREAMNGDEVTVSVFPLSRGRWAAIAWVGVS